MGSSLQKSIIIIVYVHKEGLCKIRLNLGRIDSCVNWEKPAKYKAGQTKISYKLYKPLKLSSTYQLFSITSIPTKIF